MALQTEVLDRQTFYSDDGNPGVALDGSSILITGTLGQMCADASKHVLTTGISRASVASYDIYAASQTHGSDLSTYKPKVDTLEGNNAIAGVTAAAGATYDLYNAATTTDDKLSAAQSNVDAAAASNYDLYNAATNTDDKLSAAQSNVDGAAAAAYDLYSAATNTDDKLSAAQSNVDGAAAAGYDLFDKTQEAIETAGRAEGKADDNALAIPLRARWRGEWGPGTYEANDMVRDQAYLMIANKTTSDKAAPTPAGDPAWGMPDVPPWTEAQFTGTVLSGVRINNVIQSWVITKYRIWIPDVSADAKYRVVMYDNVTGEIFFEPQFSGAVLQEPGWFEQVVPSNTYILPGDDVSILLQSINESSGLTSNIDDWDLTTIGAPLDPGTGTIARGSLGSFLAVSKNSLSEAPGWLGLVSPGSTVRINEPGSSTRWESYTVLQVYDRGTWYEYETTLSNAGTQSLRDGSARVCEFTYPTAAPTDYVRWVDSLITDPPTEATVVGQLQLGAGAMQTTNDEYGVDIEAQLLNVSPDWDIMSAPGGGGGGASSPTVTRSPLDLVADIGLIPNDPAAASHNVATLQRWFDSINAEYQTRISAPIGDFYFNDTVYATRLFGGATIEGSSGIGWPSTDNRIRNASMPDDNYQGQWHHPQTRWIWSGPVGDTNKAMLVLPGHGAEIRNIHFMGHTSDGVGETNEDFRTKDPRPIGPMAGIHVSDNWTAFTTGRNNIHKCLIFGCQRGVQIGAPSQIGRLPGDPLPATIWDSVNNRIDLTTGAVGSYAPYQDAHGWLDGTIIRFYLSTGSFPTGSAPLNATADYYIVNGTRGTFQLSTTRDGPPITFDNTAAGEFQIYMVGSPGQDPPRASNADQFNADMIQIHGCYCAIYVGNSTSIGNYIKQSTFNACADGCYIYRGMMRIGELDVNDLVNTWDGVTKHRVCSTSSLLQASAEWIVDHCRLDASIGNNYSLIDMSEVQRDSQGNTFSGMRIHYGAFEIGMASKDLVYPGTIGILAGNSRLHIAQMEGLFLNVFEVHGFVWDSGPGGELQPNPDPDDRVGPSIYIEASEVILRTGETYDPTDQTKTFLRSAAQGSTAGDKCTMSVVGCFDSYNNPLIAGGFDQTQYTIA